MVFKEQIIDHGHGEYSCVVDEEKATECLKMLKKES